MGYNKNEIKLVNENESTLGSYKLAIELLSKMNDLHFKDLIITECHIDLITKDNDNKDTCNKDVSKDQISVLINEKDMKCIKLYGNDPQSIRNFLNLLEFYSEMNIPMDNIMYYKFRKKFTELYIDAFSVNEENSYNQNFCYDTTEINRILNIRQINYKIIYAKNIKGKFQGLSYWMVININKPNPELIHGDNDLYLLNDEFINYDYIDNEEELSKIKDLSTYLEIMMKIYPTMNSYIYESFVKDFVLLYNTLYSENITINDIYNVDNFNKLLTTKLCMFKIVKEENEDKCTSDDKPMKWMIVKNN